MLGVYDPVSAMKGGVWRAQCLPRDKPCESVKNVISCVTGPNRCKFFNRPLTPPLRQVEESNVPTSTLYMEYLSKSEPPCLRTLGTQTDYRESEAQTDPWDPSFSIKRVKSDPELLKISQLKFGSGLPVGPEEVEMIARARERENWESTLPVLEGSAKDWKRRRMMVVEKENEEWQYKTQKLKEKQRKHLEIMERYLIETMNIQEQRNMKMLQRLQATKTEKAEAWRSKVRSKLDQSVQYMQRKHIMFSKRNNLVEENVDHDEMKSFQNESRHKALCEQINSVANSFYLSNPKGMEQLEEYFLEEGNMCMNPEIYLPKRDRRPSRYEKLLDGAHGDILGGKTEHVPIERSEIVLQMERPVYRPPTPSVPIIPQDELDRHQSAVVLQSTLRGRALQKEVLEGTIRNHDLICEISYLCPTQEAGKVSVAHENQSKHLTHYAELRKTYEEAYICNEVLERLEGETISEVLNVSGKEVLRHHEDKRVQNIISRAKSERRMREAEEAGRRQQELIQRKITDDIFKQVTEDRENETR